jgi:hypothetical protein
MTDPSSRRRRLPAWGCVSLGLFTTLACASHPATRAVEPLAPPMAPDVSAAPPTPATPAPASEPARSEATANSVVTLIAKPGLWPLDVDSARRVLTALGPVSREQATPNDLSLVGGPIGALSRFDVDYSLEDGKYWVFDSAGFFLGDRDMSRLYRSVEARLTQLLGKPESAARNKVDAAALPTVTWHLGEASLSLSPSSAGGEQRVLIAIRESGASLAAASAPAD